MKNENEIIEAAPLFSITLRKQAHGTRHAGYAATNFNKVARQCVELPGMSLEDIELLWSMADKTEAMYREAVRSSFSTQASLLD